MRLPALLPLVGLVLPAEVSGFFLARGGGGVSTTPPRGRRRVQAASTATDGSRRPATSMSSDGVPAVVVSFGLTPEERLVAEEAVFRRGPTFPAGVRFVDGSAGAAGDCATIRQVWGVQSTAVVGVELGKVLGKVIKGLSLFCGLVCCACTTCGFALHV